MPYMLDEFWQMNDHVDRARDAVKDLLAGQPGPVTAREIRNLAVDVAEQVELSFFPPSPASMSAATVSVADIDDAARYLFNRKHDTGWPHFSAETWPTAPPHERRQCFATMRATYELLGLLLEPTATEWLPLNDGLVEANAQESATRSVALTDALREAALDVFQDEWDGNMRSMPAQDVIYRRGWADALTVTDHPGVDVSDRVQALAALQRLTALALAAAVTGAERVAYSADVDLLARALLVLPARP